jgi:hypothetical protein
MSTLYRMNAKIHVLFLPTQTNTKINQLVRVNLRVSRNKSARLEKRCTNYLVWNVFTVALSSFFRYQSFNSRWISSMRHIHVHMHVPSQLPRHPYWTLINADSLPCSQQSATDPRPGARSIQPKPSYLISLWSFPLPSDLQCSSSFFVFPTKIWCAFMISHARKQKGIMFK